MLENETSLLVKPDESSDEFKSSDKIVVHTTDTEIEDKYEKNISLATLTVGDLIEISYVESLWSLIQLRLMHHTSPY